MSKNGMTQIDSLDRLIKAMEEYHTELGTSYVVIYNSIDAFSYAMGEDDLSKKLINDMADSLTYLEKTINDAVSMISSLKTERQKILDIYENAHG